jgi:hypothetical protein
MRRRRARNGRSRSGRTGRMRRSENVRRRSASAARKRSVAIPPYFPFTSHLSFASLLAPIPLPHLFLKIALLAEWLES